MERCFAIMDIRDEFNKPVTRGVVELVEIPQAEYEKMDSQHPDLLSIPGYFCNGPTFRVWPRPQDYVIIVKEVKEF